MAAIQTVVLYVCLFLVGLYAYKAQEEIINKFFASLWKGITFTHTKLKKQEVKKIANIREEAQAYQPEQIKTLADLEVVFLDGMDVKEDTDAEFPYKYIVVDGDKYKVPKSVLRDLNAQLAENPDIKSFKVKKAGEGKMTSYSVIILE